MLDEQNLGSDKFESKQIFTKSLAVFRRFVSSVPVWRIILSVHNVTIQCQNAQEIVLSHQRSCITGNSFRVSHGNPAVDSFSTNALLHSFEDILVKYALWASVTALICMPFISHRRIYFQSLLHHTLHGFTLNLFLIRLLINMQNLTPALKFSKVTSWHFVTNCLTIHRWIQNE